MTPPKRNVLAQKVILLVASLLRPGAARVACEDDAICVEKYRAGSVCLSDGTCSNPFASGCLRRYLGEDKWPDMRVCNSDDPPGASAGAGSAEDAVGMGVCARSPFDYDEIRILSQDWDSPMIRSWIMQILASEILGVPATIETSADYGFSFYDLDNEFNWASVTYDQDALRVASKYGDCRNAPKDVPCAHVMPEVWNGQDQAVAAAEKEGFIEPPVGNGAVSKFDWYIPEFTSKKHPELVSYIGMSNDELLGGKEDNRRKMAEIFKRPFSWKDYCEQISPNNCTVPDKFAQRPPKDESEEVKYFSEDGSFSGFFNATRDNNCEENPSTCTGHMAFVPCSWANYALPQAHHLNISVKSNGPLNAGGYTFSRLIEIWHAANATKSDLLFYWYTPDPLTTTYVGTEAEFVPIRLPQATLECAKNRVPLDQRCSEDPADWIGDEKGACAGETQVLRKLLTSNLFENTYSADEASRSPAYDTLKNLYVSTLDVDNIMRLWYERNIDRWNYDLREAVCSWTAENAEHLMTFAPRGYPRTFRENKSYTQPYLLAATAIGAMTAFLSILSFWVTWYYRSKKIMRYAQVKFLYLLLCGVLFVAIGAVTYSLQPSKATCVASQWFILLGYSLELVPLLVKVAAINKLFQEAAKMKRVTIDLKWLFMLVGALMSIVAIFLIIWTALDPPSSQEERILTTEKNDKGGLVVATSCSCASTSFVWQIIVIVYQMLLIVCATVLAFQSRNIRQDFNESGQLAFVIYSHFVFVALRTLLWIFSSSMASTVAAAIMSFLLSIDSLVMLGIYFVPKFWAAKNGTSNQNIAHDPALRTGIRTSSFGKPTGGESRFFVSFLFFNNRFNETGKTTLSETGKTTLTETGHSRRLSENSEHQRRRCSHCSQELDGVIDEFSSDVKAGGGD